jgi:teichuronic acid biosynthesis protein TuaE
MGEWDNQFGGLAQLDDGVVSTGDTDWSGNAVTKPVISGTLGEKNHYAKILLLLLPFSTAFVLFAKKRRQRYFAALCSVPICGAMLLTYSRGAFLAAVLMVFGMVVFSWLRLRTVMFASGFMLVVLVLLLPSYVYRISTLSRVAGLSSGYVTRTDSSVSRRAAENMAAIRIFKDYPILGVGPGQTKYYTNHYGQGFGRIAGTRMAHNLYLSTLSDLGLTGFMAFMAVLLIAVFRVWRARLQNSSPDLLIMGSAILLSIGVYMVCSVFLDLGYERYYWLLLALAGAYVQIVRKEDAPESARIAVATS